MAPITTLFNIETPDGNEPNDFSGDLFALAQAITGKMAGYRDGTFAARGSAGSNRGTFYNCLDNTINGGLYWSTGNVWNRLTPSPWIAWTPTITLSNGSGGIATGVSYFDSAPIRLYRMLPGSEVEFLIEGLVTLTGTQKFLGIVYTTPVDAARRWQVHAEAMNDLARARVSNEGAHGNVISIFPHG